jgi:muramoyltetrapeptide carboxypeptidase LdcA involved in peptidoglycan recycling
LLHGWQQRKQTERTGEMHMIKYPFLEKEATIGVTAPSSGVEAELHNMFKQACESMERKGYKVVCGETVWTQEKAKSASAQNYAQVVGRFRKGGDFQEILELYKSTKRDYCSYKSI